MLRLDNEAGKGDHKHLGEIEVPYRFTDLDALQADFWAEVKRRRRGK
ncbi:MAG: toxin-antitoxin system TumE family protein [Steroidobacteraceae bacterium]